MKGEPKPALGGWPGWRALRTSASLVILVLSSLGCGLVPPASDAQQATVAALGTRMAAQATQQAGEEDTDTALETAQANATQMVGAAAATQAALALLDEASLSATATAFGPFQAELPHYGVDPGAGRPGWIHPPLRLEINGKNQYDYANQFLGTVARDFVVSADITWNTQYGTSGCGFVLRSDGNQEALNQYLVIATRGANGHVVFLTMSDGEVVTGQDLYAYGLDPEFDWRNDTTNRLTVVGQGNRFVIYTNGTQIGKIDPAAPPPQPYLPQPPAEPPDKTDAIAMAAYAKALAEYQEVVNQIQAQYAARLKNYRTADKEFARGLVAMVALSESGRTICQYDNAWLWLIEE